MSRSILASGYDDQSAGLISAKTKRWLCYGGEGIAIVALTGGLYWYMEFINTIPECAQENHHGTGNCPVQLLAWYPASKIQDWSTRPVNFSEPGDTGRTAR
jgi:hypothetical protein